ncbi:putative Ig domain-containing protein, partial [Maribacter flavus]|uniref:putative Ig domain-containing protein n=1 Tax=Maribacter flavus TaxID=1658664 RepID=UPI003D345206
TTASFFWNVMEVASAPLALTPISDRSDSVGGSVDFTVTASGGDESEALVYELTGAPAGIDIDVSTGRVTGTLAVGTGTG